MEFYEADHVNECYHAVSGISKTYGAVGRSSFLLRIGSDIVRIDSGRTFSGRDELYENDKSGRCRIRSTEAKLHPNLRYSTENTFGAVAI